VLVKHYARRFFVAFFLATFFVFFAAFFRFTIVRDGYERINDLFFV